MNVYINFARHLGRSGYKTCLPPVNGFQSFLPLTTSASKKAVESYEERNERLKRPLSPHLTIYKPQLTSLLSLTHRTTGLILTGGLYAFSIGMLLSPAPFPCYFEYFESLHIATPIVFSLKFSLAWMTFYHTANGVRHLAWDMGYGYDLKTLYLSGYLVLGISLVASLLAASM